MKLIRQRFGPAGIGNQFSQHYRYKDVLDVSIQTGMWTYILACALKTHLRNANRRGCAQMRNGH